MTYNMHYIYDVYTVCMIYMIRQCLALFIKRTFIIIKITEVSETKFLRKFSSFAPLLIILGLQGEDYVQINHTLLFHWWKC